MQVTFKGKPLEIQGNPVQVGEQIPDVQMKNGQGELVSLHDMLKGKVTVLSVVPDVLTRTCELQTKHFQDATKDKGYQFITASRNTVDEFNQWNRDNQLNVASLSDTLQEFGQAMGIEIDLGGKTVLTRSVFVVDPDLHIVYAQYVPEIAEEPDYEPVLTVADQIKE